MSDELGELLHALPYRKLKHESQKARKHKGKFDYAEFIAWDGEGITAPSNGRHHYCLFANSKGLRLWDSTIRHDGRPTGISTEQAFSALIASASAYPNAIHVGYYLSYDFNMLLRDLPLPTLVRLKEGQKAYWQDYSIEVRFGKSLWIKDRRNGVSVKLWDVGSFFQQSFVKSLITWSVATDDIDFIQENKLRRSDFSVLDLDTIEEYCGKELSGLVSLMESFRDALETCNLRIQSWHGPGAIAAKLYSQHAIKHHKCTPPEEVNRAAQVAYGGGRIELVRQGHHTGRTHYYDVRSAYPSAIAELPSLASATWELSHSRTPEIQELSLYCVSWDFCEGERFYPIRHRYPNGNVCYPQTGVGTWVWTPEYELLTDYFPGQFEVQKAYIFRPGYKGRVVRPFKWVEETYYRRQKWKEEGIAAERGLKLGLNSLYGKMIQQIGWKSRDQLPAYHQLEWGGYVTSSTRAKLFRAAYGNQGIIGFETDGIITTSPLAVRLSTELGGWEVDHYDSVTYVQNGFYWLGDKVKYRGFDPGSVERDDVLKAWETGESHVQAELTRHIGLAYAMHTNHMDQWGNWQTNPRMLDVSGCSTKRIHLCERKTCKGYGKPLSQTLHDTQPYGAGMEFSTEYPLEWKQKDLPEWKREAKRMDLEDDDFYAREWA